MKLIKLTAQLSSSSRLKHEIKAINFSVQFQLVTQSTKITSSPTQTLKYIKWLKEKIQQENRQEHIQLVSISGQIKQKILLISTKSMNKDLAKFHEMTTTNQQRSKVFPLLSFSILVRSSLGKEEGMHG